MCTNSGKDSYPAKKSSCCDYPPPVYGPGWGHIGQECFVHGSQNPGNRWFKYGSGRGQFITGWNVVFELALNIYTGQYKFGLLSWSMLRKFQLSFYTISSSMGFSPYGNVQCTVTTATLSNIYLKQLVPHGRHSPTKARPKAIKAYYTGVCFWYKISVDKIHSILHTDNGDQFTD